MPRPRICVYESFQGQVTSTRHTQNAAIHISVEALDANANNPVRVLVLRQTKPDASARPDTPDFPLEIAPHGIDHTTQQPQTYNFPPKNQDCTQRIIVLAWYNQEMLQSPNPANVEVRHLALSFQG